MPTHALIALALVQALISVPAFAQAVDEVLEIDEATGKVRIDFDDVGIEVIIDAISRLSGKNFIYDDRVRGKVTVISPSPVTVTEAWAVFESVLKVKGFTAIPGPAGVLKIVPLRDAKESNIETVRGEGASPNRDQYVTRMIPLYYIDATALSNTLKPLISKDAALVVYAPTNTIILTDTKANIRRLLGILEALDVELHKEELAVIKILYADADTLGSQIQNIYGGTASGGTPTASSARRDRASRRRSSSAAKSSSAGLEAAKRGEVRIITETRTNSLLVLASRTQIAEIRELVHKLDVPVVGGGKIHVYYLKHADAQEMAKTLNELVSGGSQAAAGGGRTGRANAKPQALRSVVTPLAEGQISLSADPATNSLVIQASKEAYETLSQVIEKLDVARPQVLVEALIMEVDITDGFELGFNVGYAVFNNDIQYGFSGAPLVGASSPLGVLTRTTAVLGTDSDGDTTVENEGSELNVQMQAAAANGRVNILSSPHILTSDNEEAEIRIGDNIPIVTSRVESATGATDSGLSSSVNVERRDIGVTLRVTPQISDGETLRLTIFQEITEVNEGLSGVIAGDDSSGTTEIGVALSNRKVENTVVVADGDTVVIGGLIGETESTKENKVPFFGDIPVLGWLFKSVEETTRRTNLIIMLTPHIIRTPADLESETIYRRGDFAHGTESSEEIDSMERDVLEGRDDVQPTSLVQEHLLDHTLRYPSDRVQEIEDERREARERAQRERDLALHGPQYMVNAAIRDMSKVEQRVIEIIDLGYDATVVTTQGDDGPTSEIQVGPFESSQLAESTLVILRRSMGMDPYVVVIEPAETNGENDASSSQPEGWDELDELEMELDQELEEQ
ncbi:MAG: type II secretion system secretin GspD [Myxococcota bacterium]|nr:type II secretion system secretin GspD [Myxococcota bacterium]